MNQKYPITQWLAEVEADPENSKALHELACAYADGGDFAGAFDYFETAIALDPHNSNLHFDLAMV